nr:tRNA dihydrouridine synthase DusB [bacterium]
MTAFVLPDKLVLAPMAGVADSPFRRICRMQGCRGAYTEMVSAKGLLYQNTETVKLLENEGGWLAVQLFGSECDAIARAAEKVAGMGFAAIDLNMGCPVNKVAGHGEGSALMRTPALAARLVESACGFGLPVTVKIRLGWDEDSINCLDFARRMVDAGAAAVTLHARTRKQGYSGKADWAYIARLKAMLPVPVIGSGDVFTPEDAVAMLGQTGCDGVMVARGALGNPWFFAQAASLLKGEKPCQPDAMARAREAIRHAQLLVECQGQRAIVAMRRHVAWYVRGTRGAAAVREKINHAQSLAQMEDILLLWALEEGQGKGNAG